MLCAAIKVQYLYDSFFWERLGTKSFLFGYQRNKKRQKWFPLSLHAGRYQLTIFHCTNVHPERYTPLLIYTRRLRWRHESEWAHNSWFDHLNSRNQNLSLPRIWMAVLLSVFRTSHWFLFLSLFFPTCLKHLDSHLFYFYLCSFFQILQKYPCKYFWE